jgi:hypothetical protein
MNYDQARELTTGGWHWTTRNDDVIRTAWPCLDCPPHATRDEAERHFYEACLESVTEQELAVPHSCTVPDCQQPAMSFLGNRGLSRIFAGTALCPAHLNRATLRELHPFEPGLSVIHS